MKGKTLITIISVVIVGGIILIASLTTSREQITSQPVISVGDEAPEATFTTIQGDERMLSEFQGQKVMFWFLATWCPSCISAAQVLEKNNEILKGMTVIALKTHRNAGFPGPTIKEFAQTHAPELLEAENWIWGNASEEATQIYNPRNLPDIYFLIDEAGIVRAIDGAPAATINNIVEFATESVE